MDAGKSKTLLTRSHGDTLETRITEDSLSKCNLQEGSPLFTILPPELRNTIFELATQPYDDPKHLYRTTDYCYRPGHHAKQRIDTALLATCRLIWLETNHLPISQASPTFWFQADDRRPDWAHNAKVPSGRYSLRRQRTEYISEEERCKRFMKTLTPSNWESLRELRFMGQLCWLESNQLSYLLERRERMPCRIVVTVRHTDWWWWEDDRSLAMHYQWIKRLLQVPSSVRKAKELVLELETLEWKVEQMAVLVENTRKLVGDVDGWVLEDGAEEEVMSWKGPTNIGGGTTWAVYYGMRELRYKVFRMVWKRRE